MSYILGLSAGFHDAAASVIDNEGNIVFAAHSERYSKIKNDPNINVDLYHELLKWNYDTVAYYEIPWKRQLRCLYSGEKFNKEWTTTGAINKHIDFGYEYKTVSFSHHLSHAAAGFQTSPFRNAVVIVIDAIGELDTISIYKANYEYGIAKYKKLWTQKYPHSIGLFYSAITHLVGLKPLDEEYITMGMSAYGTTAAYSNLMKYVVNNLDDITFNHNFHTGIDRELFSQYSNEDMAQAAQLIVQRLIMNVAIKAKKLSNCDNLVFMGGVALNCVANEGLGNIFRNIWIMPNPGDAGSSLGAAALAYGKRLNWTTPFLGHNIHGDYPVTDVIDELITNKIVGVASGKAEFGPRALGNRSLLADPRGSEIKDKVNKIKRRQKFRPFAPAILEEYASKFFKMPSGWGSSPYMQTVAKCIYPEDFPAIIHVDGTSRVQTVANDGSGFRKLLETWYAKTGCPMLLNTSLNIRGEPIVNDRQDADRFEEKYGVKVCS